MILLNLVFTRLKKNRKYSKKMFINEKFQKHCFFFITNQITADVRTMNIVNRKTECRNVNFIDNETILFVDRKVNKKNYQ